MLENRWDAKSTSRLRSPLALPQLSTIEEHTAFGIARTVALESIGAYQTHISSRKGLIARTGFYLSVTSDQ